MAKIAVMGDDMTALGMRLAGVGNSVKADEGNAQETYDRLKQEADIMVITHTLFEALRSVDESKINVRIPDKNGGGGDMIKDLVKKVVGFEVKN
jgi:vacuolar-type H+-ATPase subunit F/Vma7